MITYDVGLDADGDLPAFCYAITGIDLVAQRLRLRLGTFLGDWVLDPTKGLPILRWLGTKPPNAAEIGAVVRREIETTPGVLRVEAYASTWDPATMAIAITGTVITASGELVLEVAPVGTRTNRNPGVSIFTRPGRIAP